MQVAGAPVARNLAPTGDAVPIVGEPAVSELREVAHPRNVIKIGEQTEDGDGRKHACDRRGPREYLSARSDDVHSLHAFVERDARERIECSWLLERTDLHPAVPADAREPLGPCRTEAAVAVIERDKAAPSWGRGGSDHGALYG